MKALQVQRLAADYAGCALVDVDPPRPRPGEVLVRVRAAAVNFPDLLQTRGEYQHRPDLPFILGQEAAGEVVEVGVGASFQVGDRVVGRGGYAEYALMKDPRPIPAGVDFAHAAAFGVAYLTAYVALVRRGQMNPGEWLLVHGSAGGVGLAAVDLGKALGARVIAAASSDDKLALATADGADAVVRYERGTLDLAAQKALTAELLGHAMRAEKSGPGIGAISSVREAAGYDVIFDGVGGGYAEPALRALGWQGRYLSVGFAAGMAKVALGPLLFKNAEIMGIQPADDAVRQPGRTPQAMARMFGWHSQGFLRPRITAEFPLRDAAEALKLLAERRATGRVVLTTDRM